jgi:hypothetical protein
MAPSNPGAGGPHPTSEYDALYYDVITRPLRGGRRPT